MREYFLTSERIGFDWWQKDDFKLAVLLWGDSDVSRYIAKDGVFLFKEIESKFNDQINNALNHGVEYWPIFELCSGSFMGCCGLRLNGLRGKIEQDTYEAGVHLKSEFWGKGYASEALKTVIDYAFGNLGAKTIYAGHNPLNKKSKKMLKKLGFKFVFNSFYAPTGLMHPTYVLKNAKTN